jgi:chain length determinant protein (polysaccharide antigen chain regulator)
MINYHGKADLEVERYTPDLVYKAFLRNLKSKGLRREFFDAHDLAGYYLANNSHTDANIDRIFDKKFNGSLRVQVDKQDVSFVVASFTDTDPVLAAQRLNQFIAFANERTSRQLLNNVNAAIRAEIERVRYQLDSKLKLASQRRQDRILNLREALRVAKTLGIKSTSSFPVIEEKDTAAIEINTAQLPLYMRGMKALEAEIAVLESRKSDEPFVAGLRDLQEKQAFLEDILIERDKMSAVTIDAAGRTPYRVEKPRKKLMFMLATVFGLMIGIFMVFIAEFRSKTREKSEQHAA